MSETYEVGQVVRLTVTIDVADTATDPGGLTFQMRDGAGALTSYVHGTDAELVKSATGVYYVDWTVAKEHDHRYRWVGTGTAAGAKHGRFSVAESAAYP